MIDYRKALQYIDCSTLSYYDWIRVGMSLKDAYETGENVTVQDFEEWSATDTDRYNEGEPTEKWDGFKKGNTTKSTLLWMARKNGFEPLDNIEVDPANDIIRYLRALFEDDEHVAYNITSKRDGNKYKPETNGVYGLTSIAIQEDLKRSGIEGALGDYNHEAGGWIRINPMDGEGVTDKNVTAFRNVLIESDTLPISEQLELIEKLEIPARAVVDSGGKSIHAVMRVDARNAKEYHERVDFIFSTLSKFGFDIDSQNNNPSRLSRLPGLERGDKKQRLISVNTGKKSYEEWVDFIDAYDLKIVNYADIADDLPPRAPSIIDGILRRGHKMIITAPSKAGKTQSLIELFIAIGEGTKWMNRQCTKGKVLFINLEIDEASFDNRIAECYEAMGIEEKHRDNLRIIHMRGKAEPLTTLADKIITQAKNEDFSAIIIDPIYKIQSGDENAAGDITTFTNLLTKIATQTGAALIYSHHHSKGEQSGKSSIDRGSGSGVFARDADAIIDFLELESEKEASGWEVSVILREFKDIPEVYVYYDYPIHYLDVDGDLKDAEVKNRQRKKKSKKEDFYITLGRVFDELSTDDQTCDFNEMLKRLKGINTEGTLRNKLTYCNNNPECPYTYRKRGATVVRRPKL